MLAVHQPPMLGLAERPAVLNHLAPLAVPQAGLRGLLPFKEATVCTLIKSQRFPGHGEKRLGHLRGRRLAQFRGLGDELFGMPQVSVL